MPLLNIFYVYYLCGTYLLAVLEINADRCPSLCTRKQMYLLLHSKATVLVYTLARSACFIGLVWEEVSFKIWVSYVHTTDWRVVHEGFRIIQS